MDIYLVFKIFKQYNAFGRDIYNGKIALKEADQSSLLVEIMDFQKKQDGEIQRKKQEKKYFLKNFYALFDSREIVVDVFESKIFPIKTEGTDFSDKVLNHSSLKISIPKQMIQRLPITLAQVKAGNTFENLLNEIRQIIYSLYGAKKITKEMYNNIMNSIKV